MKGYCPYCKAELVPEPRRKKKYPECSQTVYVRDRNYYCMNEDGEVAFWSHWVVACGRGEVLAAWIGRVWTVRG